MLPALPRTAHLDLVDQDQGTLRTALDELQPHLGGRTATVHAIPAEEFAPAQPVYQADLITCCRAFRWMVRPAVLAMAGRVAAPQAAVAVMGDGSLWTHPAEWTAALKGEVRAGWLPCATPSLRICPGRGCRCCRASGRFQRRTRRSAGPADRTGGGSWPRVRTGGAGTASGREVVAGSGAGWLGGSSAAPRTVRRALRRRSAASARACRLLDPVPSPMSCWPRCTAVTVAKPVGVGVGGR